MRDHKRVGRGFDRVAKIYDACVQLIFGNRLTEFSNQAFSTLKPLNSCLIVGGGSGKILRHALDAKIADQFIYAEASGKMRLLTQNRLKASEVRQVQFESNIYDVNATVDAVVFPFILDCYSEQSVESLLSKARMYLKPEGVILIVDFNTEVEFGYHASFLKSIFIKMLYMFFRSVSSIEASRLPRTNAIAQGMGFSLAHSSTMYDGWIYANSWLLDEGVDD